MKKLNFRTIKYKTVQKIYSQIRIIEIWNQDLDPYPYQNDTDPQHCSVLSTVCTVYFLYPYCLSSVQSTVLLSTVCTVYNLFRLPSVLFF